MITVKFVGGAKKSFLVDELELPYENGITIDQVLTNIQKMKPSDTIELDVNNILIAINGADSSSLNGKKTTLSDNDVVTLIPVIHGGINYIHFKLSSKNVRLYEIKATNIAGVDFLDKLRKKYPKLKLQAISKKFVLNSSHIKKIIDLSLESEKKGLLLSNKLETDLLMRFAIKDQISDAINTAGIKSNQNYILIVIGTLEYTKKLHNEIKHIVSDISFNPASAIKKHFKISNEQLNSIYSKTALEDFLVEKSAVLFRNTSF